MKRAEVEGAELSLAERKRLLVRDELGSAALKLLAAQGFENTTIDQIVAAAGVSRRTFFRYFKSKEDVIIEFVSDVGDYMRAELARRPARERPIEAMRQVLAIAVENFAEHPEKTIALVRLVMATPALKGTFLERQSESARGLAAVLADRSGLPPGDLRSRMTADFTLIAFQLAVERWAECDGAEPLAALLAEALDAATHALSD